MNKIRISIIGVGGYAGTHMQSIEYAAERGLCELQAAVIRNPNKSNYMDIEADLKHQGVRIYRDYREMLRVEQGKLDLIAAPGGIDQHEEQSVAALEAGYNVLCEKPAAGSVAEALRMQEAAFKSKKFLAIGYQQIFSSTIQRIKKISVNGDLGKLFKAKTAILWPRDSLYYKRNSWAGKMQVDGKWIYDCPIQNATAHFLNNMIYLAGSSMEESAIITGVYGENYRAKQNEAPDTQYLRLDCKNGVIIQHIATHATGIRVNPVIELFFEKGKIEWIREENGRTRVFEGTEEEYQLIEEFDNGELTARNAVFVDIINAINENRQPLCNINNAIQHLVSVERSFASGEIITIPEQYLEKLEIEPDPNLQDVDFSKEHNIVIKDIEDIVKQMHEQETGFNGLGLPWAKESQKITIR